MFVGYVYYSKSYHNICIFYLMRYNILGYIYISYLILLYHIQQIKPSPNIYIENK